mmetsp:Transcript_101009/g.289924  ORF Transcript_101009/g.289924 Transcript_101009/m.289924 type:complete len:354 (-) Transcript_101009:172-1233(-)
MRGLQWSRARRGTATALMGTAPGLLALGPTGPPVGQVRIAVEGQRRLQVRTGLPILVTTVALASGARYPRPGGADGSGADGSARVPRGRGRRRRRRRRRCHCARPRGAGAGGRVGEGADLASVIATRLNEPEMLGDAEVHGIPRSEVEDVVRRPLARHDINLEIPAEELAVEFAECRRGGPIQTSGHPRAQACGKSRRPTRLTKPELVRVVGAAREEPDLGPRQRGAGHDVAVPSMQARAPRQRQHTSIVRAWVREVRGIEVRVEVEGEDVPSGILLCCIAEEGVDHCTWILEERKATHACKHQPPEDIRHWHLAEAHRIKIIDPLDKLPPEVAALPHVLDAARRYRSVDGGF